MVESPHGQFAIFVGHVENGASETVRSLGERHRAAARAGRCRQDTVDGHARRGQGVARRKLEMLAQDLRRRMRSTARCRRMASWCACRASFPRSRASCASAWNSSAAWTAAKRTSPVLDALFAQKEPKTGTDGTMSWTVDVLNVARRRRLRARTEGAGAARRPAPSLLGVDGGRLSARARRPVQAALARHARDRSGVDRHEAAQAARLPRAARRLHGAACPAATDSRTSRARWPTSRGSSSTATRCSACWTSAATR